MEVGAYGGILVGDESQNHWSLVAIVNKVAHQARHRYQFDIGVLANALEKFVDNLVAKFVIYSNECVINKLQANYASRLPRSIVCSHKYSALTLDSLHCWLGIRKGHSAAKLIVAATRLADGVDYLLGEILITLKANVTKLLFAPLGEGVTQIVHNNLATIANNVGYKQIYDASNYVVSDKVG